MCNRSVGEAYVAPYQRDLSVGLNDKGILNVTAGILTIPVVHIIVVAEQAHTKTGRRI